MVARNSPNGAAVYKRAPASTRRFSGTTSATIAAPAAHSPPMPSDAMMRKNTSVAMFGANAQAAEAIGNAAEHNAADRPPDQQQRRENARPLQRRGARRRRAERDVQQHWHSVRRH